MHAKEEGIPCDNLLVDEVCIVQAVKVFVSPFIVTPVPCQVGFPPLDIKLFSINECLSDAERILLFGLRVRVTHFFPSQLLYLGLHQSYSFFSISRSIRTE